MKRFKKPAWAICLLSALFFVGEIRAAAGAEPDAGTFPRGLERLRSVAGSAGVQLVSLPSGQTVREYRSRELFVPASLVKLLTSYAALKKLGPGFRFKTVVYAAAEPAGGVIAGDVWIKGGGDPLFTCENARMLAQALKERGIRRIGGGIFADNSFFDPPLEHVCLDGDCSGSYNPVVSATSVDFNLLTVRLSVPAQPGKPVTVDSPAGDYVRVSGRAVSGKKGGGSLRVRSLGATGNGREEIQVSGQGSRRGPRVREYRFHAADPPGLFAHTMRRALADAGIRVEGGSAREGTVPPEARPIAFWDSAPLAELVATLNKHSNNFMAETVLRNLGGYVSGAPGTSAKGIAAIGAALSEAGIADEGGSLDCGSGLSRFCRISPGMLCRLLTAAWRDREIGDDFLASLAVNAEEGTLRRRMRKPGLTVRGKTGTLSDVIGFAGYVSGPSGRTFAVAVMLNEVRDRARARQAIDAFIEEVAFSER